MADRLATPSADLSWFVHDRFGIFVHWGLYALGARGEWVMFKERIPAEKYEKWMRYFTADRYDPDEWARQAVNAGAKYIVLTTKHHDGFCLWDSKLTDYTVMRTPAGRDLVRLFVDAARNAGLKVGLYHSLMDWHHPDIPIDYNHSLRDDPDVEQLNVGRDLGRYREYLHGQVRELLTDYGKIDYLFYDFSNPDRGRKEWGSEELLRITRELQPGIIVNERLDIPGDIVTPEEYLPHAQPSDGSQPLVWETCQTLDGAWGYLRDIGEPRPVDLLIRNLIDSVSKGGNLLLNVGPTGRGEFDGRASASLSGIGDWMSLHGRAIYGAVASELVPPPDVRYTRVENRLYVHVFSWPLTRLHLHGLEGKVEYAQFVHDDSEVAYVIADPVKDAESGRPDAQPAGTVTLELPVRRPDVAVPVVELFLTD